MSISRRRAHRAPERRQVGAVQSHRRRRQRHRLRGGRHHARPPLRATDWDGTPFWLVDTGGADRRSAHADGRRDPAAGDRGDRRSGSAAVRRRREGRPASERLARRRAAARLAEAVDARREQGRRSAHDGLLRVLLARRRRSVSRLGASTARTPAICSTRSSSDFPRPSPKTGDALRVAVIGRPNVGKSSFVNRLLGEERLVVSDDRRHDARRDRHADDVSRPRAHLRRHRRPAPPGEDRRRHRVLLVAAHAPRDRARGHLHPHGRRDRRRDPESGSQDRRARVGSRARADRRRQQVGPREKDDKASREVREGGGEKAPFLKFVPFLFTSALTGQRVTKMLELICSRSTRSAASASRRRR